jgi:hypothetical protein
MYFQNISAIVQRLVDQMVFYRDLVAGTVRAQGNEWGLI